MMRRRWGWWGTGLLVGGVALGVAGAAAWNPRFDTSRKAGRALTLPVEDDAFTFAIFGDRTGGQPEGIDVLQRAVRDVNLVGPDLVMTVGDLVQGYNTTGEWLKEMRQFRGVMDNLRMPWFPVAGNHDIYWRGRGRRPAGEHESDYEKHFGPLWYAFSHKGCWFIVLYSDEGDPATGEKTFHKPAAQQLSPEQTAWLQAVMKRAAKARHVFVFLHHPRWRGGGYGDDWERVHAMLRRAGNVTAVFAGHIHRMTYGGKRNGIEYFTLATTGGGLRGDDREAGLMHHYDLVTVRDQKVTVAAVPVGSLLNPREIVFDEDQQQEQEVLARTLFSIKTEEGRVQRWALELPALKVKRLQLRVGVGHSYDDAGDRGLVYRLRDPSGQVVRHGFISTRNTFWVRVSAAPGAKWTLEVEDADTKLSGKYAGNGGSVIALIRY